MTSHIPVLLNEVIDTLSPEDEKIYVDATFGAGGYTRAILQSANCKVIAFDRDPTVKEFAEQMKNEFGDRFEFIHSNFANIATNIGGFKVDGVVYDLGISSMQIDQAERGFSFQKDGPLDMRMNNTTGISAKDVINQFPEQRLADIIYRYGDERKSRQIARQIMRAREIKEIDSTLELVKIIENVKGKAMDKKTHPATKTFQAIRIFINEELSEIEHSLNSCKDILNVGGKLVVVTFHSGEDKIVKNIFNQLSGRIPQPNRHDPEALKICSQNYDFALISKKVKIPESQELKNNVRARSAKLRGIQRIND